VTTTATAPLLDPLHEPVTLLELLSLRVAASPHEPALLFGDSRFTWAELDRATDGFSASLAERGIGRGDSVALFMGNHADFVLAWWGIAKAGAVEVPVNTAYKGALLRYVVDDCGARLVLVDPDLATVLSRIDLPNVEHVVVRGSTEFDALLDGRGGRPRVELEPWDPAAIMYTSGTTGPSKGVVLPHNYFANMGAVNAAQRGVGPEDVLYTCLPLFHGNAQLLTFMTGLVAGVPTAIGERFSVSGFWPDLRRFGATQFNYIGTILTLLLKGEPGAEEGQSVRLAWGAGAKAETWEAFETRFGIEVREAYGMTENGMVLYTPAEAARRGSCGKPIAMADVVVADKHDRPVGPGVVGELLTRPRAPWTMMLGYHRMPDRTADAFRNLWFHTGDAAYADEDGYVYFVDRIKDAIRRRGENISSFEVEQLVNAHPEVVESAAVPVPSELGEDEVLVCLVSRGAPEAFPFDEFAAFCREQMPRFMVPRYVRVVDRLPKTPTERVEKYRLREEGVTVDTWDAEART
jgi:crotonobetaine/carnitine-CoA ligase